MKYQAHLETNGIDETELTIGYYSHPRLGLIEITANSDSLTKISFTSGAKTITHQNNEHIQACIRQLDEYFNKKRRKFDLPLQLDGSEFEVKVWHTLREIPYGETLSYKKLAEKVGSETYARIVGSANSKNKIFIVIPCHRVIASDGKLTGYAGELWRKDWLLAHEGAKYLPSSHSPQQTSLF